MGSGYLVSWSGNFWFTGIRAGALVTGDVNTSEIPGVELIPLVAKALLGQQKTKSPFQER